MKTIVSMLAIGFSFALFACAKKPEPVAVEPPPIEEVKPPPPPRQVVVPQEDPLEAERRRLEALMNKIMADDVYFEFDKSTLTLEAKNILTEVGDILKRETRFSVLTEGHTDERGTESYNMALGMRRAESVVKFLKDYGVASNRLTKVSYGEEHPKASGNSEDAYSQNRRAAFKVQINR
jgi:peptidoglycan-associated lipoprotein